MRVRFFWLAFFYRTTVIEDCEFILHQQSFEISSYAHGAGVWSYYSITIQGTGKFYPSEGLITIDYSMYRNDNSESQKHHIEMYNYDKYKASGKYLGDDNEEVYIEQMNDTISLNIKGSFENQDYHWENIKGNDYGCGFYCAEQEVIEINTNETQVIYVVGHKEKNSIDIIIYGLYGSTSFDNIRFSVNKD